MGLWTLKNKKILIIDDFAEMRSMLRSMLRAYGAEEIKQSPDGEDAVEKIANNKFDIILCDYNLGEGKDGQQVLEEAKHRGILPLTTTFIMVTAENTSMMVMGALDYQPDAYLSKPITKTTLQTRLKKILDKKEFTKKIAAATDRKEYSKAIALCNEEMASHPVLKLELQSLKYNLYTTTGDFEDAKAVCCEVLAERDVPWAQLGLARVYFQQQNYEEAKQMLEEIIAENSDFVAAYDWLAKVQKKLGDLQCAEETIAKAVEKSPKSLLRQRVLGELAAMNENSSVAERARRDAVLVGKHSVLKQPDDYVSYAHSMLKNNKGKDAVKVASNIQRVFKGDKEAKLQSEICKGSLYQELGNDAKAKEAIDLALNLYEEFGARIPSKTSMELAKGCLKYGRQEEADSVVKCVARNNHDNKEVLQEIGQVYEDAGMGGVVSETISDAVNEIAEINNQGVELINQGKIKESIDLFKKAAAALPQNHVINLNTAQSYILLMQKEGASKQHVADAMCYLDAVKDVDAARQKYTELLKRCRKFAALEGL